MESSTNPIFSAILPVLFALVAICVFAWWISSEPSIKVEKRIPNMDGAPTETVGNDIGTVVIGEYFKKFEGETARLAGKWPCFRGEERDNRARSGIHLSNTWKNNAPKVLWEIPLLGEGHASPAVLNGRVYLLDYDEKLKSDALRCLSLKDGAEIWRRWYRVKAKRNHGISRTIPAVTGKHVVTIGPRCQVMCVDAVSGDFKWGIDMVRELGTDEPFWYTGQCPLIDDEVAVLAPCGEKVLMMGVDCESGKTLWKTPNRHKWKMSHSSIITATVNGVKTYVYAAIGGIIGVSAEPANRGEELWSTSAWSFSVVAPSIVHLGDGRFFMTSGYGAGGMLFKIGLNNRVEVLQKYQPSQGLCSEQQTPVAFDGRIYSILPKDAGKLRKQFVCCPADDCRKILWSSGIRFGLGPYVLADGKFYILSDDGTLFMVKPERDSFRLLGKIHVIPDGRDAWGPLAVAGGRLLLRDLTRLYCVDISQTETK